MRSLWILGLAFLSACGGASLGRVRAAQEPALREYLSAEESWVREEAVRVLGRHPSEENARLIEARLLDGAEKVWVRAGAADSLGVIRDPASLGVLIGVASSPGVEPELKLALIRALCRFEDPSALQAIAPLTRDEDLLVAAAAEKEVQSRCGR